MHNKASNGMFKVLLENCIMHLGEKEKKKHAIKNVLKP